MQTDVQIKNKSIMKLTRNNLVFIFVFQFPNIPLVLAQCRVYTIIKIDTFTENEVKVCETLVKGPSLILMLNEICNVCAT